jgi:hypothetical protein
VGADLQLRASTQVLRVALLGIHRVDQLVNFGRTGGSAHVVTVEISDTSQRESLAAFLDATFAGSMFDRDKGLELDVSLSGRRPEAELRYVEGLLRAWRGQEHGRDETEVRLTALPAGTNAGDRQRRLVQRRLWL